MINGHRRGPTFEPGAYGGAWTLASSVQLAAQGVDRVFHWGCDENFSEDGHHIYYGNAWVMASARKLFGPSSAANVSVLVAPGDAPDGQTLAVSKQAGEMSADVCASTTTASGVGGPLRNGTGIGLLVSVFSQRKDCTAATTVSVAFQCPTPSACGEGAAPAVRIMVLNHTTSVYGQILRAAGDHEGWLRYDDGEAYPLGGAPANSMLTPTGLAGIKERATHWLRQQTGVFTPREMAVSDRVTVTCSGGGCTATIVASPPSVHALFVEL